MVYETPDEQLRSAKRALAVQRDGGTHRSGPRSIGKGSAQLKAKALLKRTMMFGAALLAILTAASVAGMVLNGIGFWGVMATALACLIAAGVFTQFPRTRVPQRAELTLGKSATRRSQKEHRDDRSG